MGTELTRTTSTKKKRPIVGLDLDDREVHGHGQQLLARAGRAALSQNVLFYFRLRGSLCQLRCPGRTLFLSYQPLYSDCPIFTLSLINPRVPTWAVIKVRAADGL